jgi:hypothetical protein
MPEMTPEMINAIAGLWKLAIAITVLISLVPIEPTYASRSVAYSGFG